MRPRSRFPAPLCFALLTLAVIPLEALAKTVRYELTVRNQKINLSGKKEVDFALTVNGGIPAPTLEFTEGDDAEILVKNEIPNEEVSIHWHGILLPPEEDGVAYVNTPPIFPGASRLFKFKIRQSGTYWYHSHTMVQEQKGVYGALVIHPRKKAIAYDKDAVLVLSDWSDENADQIMRNLRKDGDYYLYKKGTLRSYLGAIQAGGLGTQLHNEWTRMGGMDLSDVGYDAFLINGKRDSQLLVAHPGERVRLRIINAGASSYFYVAMGVPMTVIAADGVDIKPVQAQQLLMGMAETYDVLFTVPEHKNYEIRATVQDVTGSASAWIGMGPRVPAPEQPYPNLYGAMDHSGGHGEHATHAAAPHAESAHSEHAQHTEATTHAGHGSHHEAAPTPQVSHEAHSHHTGEHAAHGTSPDRSSIDWSSQSDAMLRQNGAERDMKKAASSAPVATLTVDDVEAIQDTTLPKNAKVHEVKLVLGGDMKRYVWHLNGKAIHQDRLLMINRGEVIRFTFENGTMMHHPMHFHGHFFRVINGKGERSPLKHTVDVPPHGARTIEFYANEPGQWMLHCHNLYHMKTGMARVVRYNDFKLTPEMQKHDHHDPHLHEHLYTHTQLEAASNHASARFRLIRTWDEVLLKAETANVDGKNFSFGQKWETEGDLYYRRWFSNFLNVYGGGSLYDDRGYVSAGMGYVLPFLIEARGSINRDFALPRETLRFRLDLERRFQWTASVFSDVELAWRPSWGGVRDVEYEVSLMYGPTWAWAAGLMWTDKNIGIGAQFQF